MDEKKRVLGRGRGIIVSNQPSTSKTQHSRENILSQQAGSLPTRPQPQAPWIKPSDAPEIIPAQGLISSVVRPGAPPLSMGRGTSHRATELKIPAEKIKDGNGNGAARGNLRGKRMINEIITTKPKTCSTKRGVSGNEVVLQANYFRAIKKLDWNLYQYRVDFAPDIEYLKVRKGIIYSKREHFGAYIFDGTVLFCCRELGDKDLQITAKNNNDEVISVILKYVGILKPTDYQSLQILNLILRKSMEGLKLQVVGRNLFDAMAKIDVKEYKLELWPGYVTSFRQHEKDILLCAEIAHKVMRTDTLYSIFQKCIREGRNSQDNFKAEVIGMTVLTDYNNKTYRIDDIDFKSSVNSLFETKNGNISYVDYYKKRYNITIRDTKQPLLVSKSTDKKRRGGESEFVMLVPELCRATGLNEMMRQDFKLMRAVSNYTRLDPRARTERLKVFNQRLYNTKESMEVLESWNLTLDKHLVEFCGRILNIEDIYFGNNSRVKAGPSADWQNQFRNNSMLTSITLKRWFIICSTFSEQDSREFVNKIIMAARDMKMQIAEPRVVILSDDRNGTLIQTLENCCVKDPQLICVIVPNNNAERYACIKKKLCVDRAIPSQVIVHKTIRPKNVKSLISKASKVAIQINCKLMGTPWAVHIPCRGLMTIGFDVCHSNKDRSKSYGAMVATMDLKISNQYFSTVSEHASGNELSNEVTLNVTKALHQYREVHGTLPEYILFYRDGVSDGEINQVYEHEVKLLKERLDSIYESANIPNGCHLCFMIVSKRINTRYFLNKANPPPGTVVDDVITLPERYDFFLVSQCVTQGTISPTSYNIIYDNSGLNADKLQILTYKFTHLYYNWAGTIRVPAVCQYAHKLAYLVGEALHRAPNAVLEKQLYFL